MKLNILKVTKTMLHTKIFDQALRLKNAITRTVLNSASRKENSVSLLLITSNNSISASQIFPFYYFQSELRRRCKVVFSEVSIDKLLSGKPLTLKKVDVVIFQPWFDVAATDLSALFEKVRSRYPFAKFVFLDSYAPVDLRLAESLDRYVDVYVKKHVFRDRVSYGKETFGDTNLVEYYGKLYGLSYSPTTFKVPAGFLDKLVVGPSFLTSNVMLPIFSKGQKFRGVDRHIDVHARLGGKGEDWYGRMRTHAIQAICAIPSANVVTGIGKSYSEYLRELYASKLCFSPFGFGEVCWRDYEAVMCGAVLIKPDMAHVETKPDIFVPYETYVPVRWDFSDLEEKVTHYLSNEQERMRIAENAYGVLQKYAESNGFVEHVKTVLTKVRQSNGLGVAASTKTTGIEQ